jgi:hypothetical protein
MDIEIKTGNFNDWYKKARQIAEYADLRKKIGLKTSKYTLILENEDDVNDAYASAYLHRYHPESFRYYPTFADPNFDPLHGLDKEKLKKIASNLTVYDEPWFRREKEGGVDTLGTFVFSSDPHKNIAVFLMFLRLPMEHLAFLSTWTDENNPVKIEITDDNKIIYGFSKISGSVLKEMVVVIQMLESESTMLKRARDILQSNGDVFFATPSTLNAHNILLNVNNLAEIPWKELKTKPLTKSDKTLFNSDINSLDSMMSITTHGQFVI